MGVSQNSGKASGGSSAGTTGDTKENSADSNETAGNNAVNGNNATDVEMTDINGKTARGHERDAAEPFEVGNCLNVS